MYNLNGTKGTENDDERDRLREPSQVESRAEPSLLEFSTTEL